MTPSFEERIAIANSLVTALTQNFWDKVKHHGILHVPYGYEHHVPESVQNRLKRIYTTTARHIRFTPDYFIVTNNKVFLLEYKVMKTPRYSEGERQWDIGQMEADAWENYRNLQRANIEIAILIYCPYHSRPLLCGYPDDDWIIRERTQVITTRGSGTPYVNIDLLKIEIFDHFVAEEMGISHSEIETLLDHSFFDDLRNNPLLQTTHHPRSPYANHGEYATGFNWEPRYIQE